MMVDSANIGQTAEEVERGNKRILRLPESAEEGRILGGRTAIEASLIVGIAETADRTEPDVATVRKRQEIALEEYAKHKGIWMDYARIEATWEGVEGRGGQRSGI
ncbi:MAG: hypothetical protein LBU62_02580 [Bacteroidales bacterium]|jgi:hypothetical protein|nr:hypothetical protein [Bacteroidales bacterium]